MLVAIKMINSAIVRRLIQISPSAPRARPFAMSSQHVPFVDFQRPAAMVQVPAAALLLAAVMVGALVAHLTVLHGPPTLALILLALAILIAWLRR